MTGPAKQTTRTRVLAIITEIYGFGAETLTNETKLLNLGGFRDSLLLFKRLETEFSIRIGNEETLDVLSIGDAIALVAKKIDDATTE